MKKITHRWQRKSCLLLMLIAFGGAAPLKAAVAIDKAVVKPIAWEITGKVTSSAGEALPGVTVLLKGTTTGTSTGVDGSYSLSVPETGGTLIFSFIGYNPVERAFSGPGTINVSLTDDAKALQEVVVTGYGQAQSRRDLTGAIASVTAEQITQTPITTVEQALQGRAAGVQVTQASGAPGAGVAVTIRGINTINTGNGPLYVVDGMPLAAGNINGINPADIESMEVLKDASATAIYGSRAAGGVVLITTKRGKSGKGQVTLDAYGGVQNVWRTVPVLNSRQLAEINNEARRNANIQRAATGQDLLPFNPEFANPAALGEGTDWQKELFRPAKQQSYQLGFSGGGEKSNYNISAGYLNQEGIIINTMFDRYNFRVNTDNNISDRLKIGESITLSHTRTKGVTNADEFNGPINAALIQQPLRSVRRPDGRYDFGDGGPFQGDVNNPIRLAELNDQEDRDYRILGSIYGSFELFKGLRYISRFGIDANFNDRREFVSMNQDVPRPPVTNSANNRYNRGFSTLWTNTLNYDRTFADIHKLSAVIGTDAQTFKYDGFTANREGFPNEDQTIRYLDAGQGRQTNSGYASEASLMSYLGRATYSFRDKYLVTATYRIDGSSKFSPTKRFAHFPSASLGWRISDEGFMDGLPFLSDAKLRVSYGSAGAQAIPDYIFFPSLAGNLTYVLGNNVVRGYAPTTISNPNLQWETSTQADIGFDFGLMDNRIVGTVDYFIKDTKDMLLIPPFSNLLGVDNGPFENAASLRNQGWELSLGYRKNTGDFTFSSDINFSRIRNEITDLGRGRAIISGGTRSGNTTRTEVGQPVGAFYGWKMDGLFQTQEEVDAANGIDGKPDTPFQAAGTAPGDIRYVDIDNNGVIDDNDRTYLGDPSPNFNLGFTTNAAYKGFDFSVFFQGQFGNKIYNALKYYHDIASDPNNKSTRILDRWTGPGTSNFQPRVTYDDPNKNVRPSDFYIEDGSYVRIKNMQFGYTLPVALTQRASIQRLRIYVSAQNLATFTNYSGLDPEFGPRGGAQDIGASSQALQRGIDTGNFPQSRLFQVGVNVGF